MEAVRSEMPSWELLHLVLRQLERPPIIPTADRRHRVVEPVYVLPPNGPRAVDFLLCQQFRGADDAPLSPQTLRELQCDFVGGGARVCGPADCRRRVVVLGCPRGALAECCRGNLCCAYHVGRHLCQDHDIAPSICAEAAYAVASGGLVWLRCRWLFGAYLPVALSISML